MRPQPDARCSAVVTLIWDGASNYTLPQTHGLSATYKGSGHDNPCPVLQTPWDTGHRTSPSHSTDRRCCGGSREKNAHPKARKEQEGVGRVPLPVAVLTAGSAPAGHVESGEHRVPQKRDGTLSGCTHSAVGFPLPPSLVPANPAVDLHHVTLSQRKLPHVPRRKVVSCHRRPYDPWGEHCEGTKQKESGAIPSCGTGRSLGKAW